MTEILAPAGSFEAMQAAVRAGADAVYFGAASFNARRNAKNFTDSDLYEAAAYCRIRGVQTYLTLNTLISDSEINGALELVKTSCKAGIDGIIIQDIGLASIIKQAAPDMSLHASTQMSVHTPEGVRLLHSMGFVRVVLARENSREEIIEIAKVAKQLGVELEIFVQGAMCMSVSGQCLLSAVLGSRSGNRGLCAGSCRLPFNVKNGNGHDLSLKDMCLYPFAEELNKLGIASLKIEGRMKRPEYVAMATDAARAALYEPHKLAEKMELLKSVFSRSGFSDGYYTSHVDADMFGTRSADDISGTKQVLNSIHDIYRRERQSVAVDFDIKIRQDMPVSLTVSDKINSVTVTGAVPEIAQNRPCDADSVKEKLCKCGGTPYFVDSFTAEIDGGLAVPASLQSTLRSSALEKLSTARSQPPEIKFTDIPLSFPEKRTMKAPQLYVSLHSSEQLPKDISDINMLILPLETDVEKVQNLIMSGINVAVKTPPAMFSREQQIQDKLNQFHSAGVEYAVAENLGALNLICNAGMKIIGGMRLNCYNSFTAKALGLDKTILSCELDENQLADIRSDIPCGIFAYGRLPLMLLRNCPMRSRNGCAACDGKITDRMNTQFMLMCEDKSTMLFNDRVLYLADRPYILNRVDFAVLSFTDETSVQVDEIINSYKNHTKFSGKFTRGMYVKGVK